MSESQHSSRVSNLSEISRIIEIFKDKIVCALDKLKFPCFFQENLNTRDSIHAGGIRRRSGISNAREAPDLRKTDKKSGVKFLFESPHDRQSFKTCVPQTVKKKGAGKLLIDHVDKNRELLKRNPGLAYRIITTSDGNLEAKDPVKLDRTVYDLLR